MNADVLSNTATMRCTDRERGRQQPREPVSPRMAITRSANHEMVRKTKRQQRDPSVGNGDTRPHTFAVPVSPSTNCRIRTGPRTGTIHCRPDLHSSPAVRIGRFTATRERGSTRKQHRYRNGRTARSNRRLFARPVAHPENPGTNRRAPATTRNPELGPTVLV